MQTIAEFGVEAQKQLLHQFIAQIENDIWIFYFRLLDKINSTTAAKFKTDMDKYPTVPEPAIQSPEVKEVLEFIAASRNAYSAGLRTKHAKDVENEIKQEKKLIGLVRSLKL